MIKKLFSKHRPLWQNKNFRLSSFIGFSLLCLSLIFYYFAASYATNNAGSGVSDIILSRLPVLDTSFLFIWGGAAVLFFTIGLIIYEPKFLPFLLKSAGLFVVIRSLFIVLTHLGPPLTFSPSPNGLMQTFNFAGDLFFSGHAGMPFLMALVFWQNKTLRLIFLFSSIILSAAVLLGHLHYSIDVFAAYFISFTIFHICKKLFSKDYAAFN